MYRMRVLPRDYLIIALFAILGVFAVFAHAPLEITATSADGRVTLFGQAPKSFGTFRIMKADAAPEEPYTEILGPIYAVTPNTRLLPIPITVSISYTDVDLHGHPPRDLVLGYWDVASARWQEAPSIVREDVQTVYAQTRTLSLWALMVQP